MKFPTLTPAGVVAMGCVLPILDCVAVALRFWAKHKVRRVGIDDWLILVSLILTIGLGAILIDGSVSDAFGRSSPPGDTGPDEQDRFLVSAKKLTFFFDWIQIWAFGTAKLSVLFFYRSIFVGKAFNVVSWSMIFVVIAWTLGGFLPVIFQCDAHIDYKWTSAANVALHCIRGTAVGLGFSIPDVITDGLILAMPLYWTSKLHMSFWKKLSVCGVFLFGGITIVASIIRLIIYVIVYPGINHACRNILHQLKTCLGHNTNADQIAFYSTLVYWSMLEMGLSVIAACLPTLSPLFRDLSIKGISQRLRSTFTMTSRSSKAPRSVSETNMVRRIGAENNVGFESIAMGNYESDNSHEIKRSEEAEGQIMVTRGLSMRSSFDAAQSLEAAIRP